ncbi:MAG: VOC family protein [Alphaproteobacteria bacterium]|jgi:catechol 2,3-dioxygenase-like lactoylglutathione lyase family enzyme|nr:VOC family protein [Alphaproteobacteria bacterium]
MAATSPLWPAELHHFRMNSADPEALVAFYEKGFAMTTAQVAEDLWHLAGPGRRILIGRGESTRVAFAAYVLDDPVRLEALEAHIRGQGAAIEASPSPLFGNAAFSVRDPDGQRLVFGVLPEGADAHASTEGLPGRTQHIVFSSTQLPVVAPFYRDVLGFVVSDEVIDDDGAVTACFLRSDELHHSYAVFRGDGQGYDHHALEVDCWNDIRDWGDHFASMRVPIWWGPGRHGPGNNLFFMISDPDGNRIELSAEQELMPREMAMRTWPHDEHTLNLWGNAWMRS